MADKPSFRDFVESTGVKMDDVNNPNNPNYEAYQKLANDAMMALYGNVGANMDTRDWGAIMASGNPLQAAKDALKQMYSDPAYLKANAENLLAKGYLPEQADYTYQQMQGRVGSTYDPNWTKGSRFEGAVDTQGYLNGVKTYEKDPAALAKFETNLWQRWKSDPAAKTGLVDSSGTGGGSTTGGVTPGSGVTPGTVINVGPGTYGGGVTPGSGLAPGTQSTTTIGSGASVTPGSGVTPATIFSMPVSNQNVQSNASAAKTGFGAANAAGLIASNQGRFFGDNPDQGNPFAPLTAPINSANVFGVTPSVGLIRNNSQTLQNMPTFFNLPNP